VSIVGTHSHGTVFMRIEDSIPREGGITFSQFRGHHRLVAPDGLETMGPSPTPEILWTVKLERIILT
jgi:hypothetical protein